MFESMEDLIRMERGDQVALIVFRCVLGRTPQRGISAIYGVRRRPG